MFRIIPLLFIIILSSCAATNQPIGSKNSPSNVVMKFVDSIKANDFESAFKYIHAPMTDKQGYISRMENLVENSNNKIIAYKLIGTRIIGGTAYVIVDLELDLSSEGSEKSLLLTRNQYVLNLINSKWKVVSDKCISNCINT